MASKSNKVANKSNGSLRIRPALTPEGQEAQCISMAMDLAMQRLADGTASSQILAHFLKLGSSREKLEQERLANENLLTKAKTESIKSSEETSKRYAEAIEAMKKYSGNSTFGDEEC